MNKNIKPHLALFTVAVAYGLNYIVAKGVMQGSHLSPNAFVTLRALFGLLAFAVIKVLWIKEKVDRKDLFWFLLCGVFGVVINMLCFFNGLKLTSPINASLIMMTTPILVLVISSIVLKEKFTLRKVLGIALGTAGAFILILYAGTESKASSITGDVLIFINALSYGLYLVLVKRMMKKYHPFTVIFWVFVFGASILLPIGGGDLLNTDYAAFSKSIWWSILFVLLGPTLIAYMFNAYALSKVNATVVSAYIYLQPLLATSFAIFLGMDMLNLYNSGAAIFIFWGVYLVSFSRK